MTIDGDVEGGWGFCEVSSGYCSECEQDRKLLSSNQGLISCERLPACESGQDALSQPAEVASRMDEVRRLEEEVAAA